MKDRVIIITGAASGIGEATALQLADEGAKLVLSDINEEAGKSVLEAVKTKGAEAYYYTCDVSDKAQVEALVDFAVEQFGSLYGLFNNAGIGAMTSFLDLQPADYEKMIAINQNSVFYGLHYAGKKMKELGVKSGVIVNTASIYGFIGAEGSAHYNAAKAAVVSLTKSAAQALTPYGIRVVGVAPGFTKTAILDNVPADMLKALEGAHMRNKLLTSEEIANVVAFLFSEASVAINGSTVLADDGYLAFK